MRIISWTCGSPGLAGAGRQLCGDGQANAGRALARRSGGRHRLAAAFYHRVKHQAYNLEDTQIDYQSGGAFSPLQSYVFHLDSTTTGVRWTATARWYHGPLKSTSGTISMDALRQLLGGLETYGVWTLGDTGPILQPTDQATTQFAIRSGSRRHVMRFYGAPSTAHAAFLAYVQTTIIARNFAGLVDHR
ncbi:MAG TPA: hypothetical protein VGO93_24335 [Candidatus Xenobia bacterium]